MPRARLFASRSPGDLDSERILFRAFESMQSLLPGHRVSVWLTDGTAPPRRVLPGASGDEAPPPILLRAARRRKAVSGRREGLALPMIAPTTGLIAVVFTDRRPPNGERGALESLVAEAASDLDRAHLYERALAEKDRAEAILSRVVDAIYVTDPSGTVLSGNPAAIELSGRRQVDGFPCGELFGLHAGEARLDCATGCPLLEELDANDRGVEVWRSRTDGRRQPFLANASPVLDQAGALSEVVHSLRDITKLKEADEAKTLFLATASHELKTPLTVIQGFAQTMLRSPDLDGEERDEAIEAIARRAVGLRDIVERLLLSSRIEAGRIKLNLEPVDLLPLAEERVASLANVAARDIRLDATSPVPPARAELNGITTVLDHLLENAVKYSPDGGDIVVSLGADDTRVELRVRDHGVGMDADQEAHCFDRFWQAESTDVRRFGGTGIGLYIVRSLVEAMDGQVTVDSALGKGSTFKVILLRADAIRPEQHEAKAALPVTPEPSVIREFMRQIGVPDRRER